MGTSAPTSSVGFRQQRHELNNGEVREASRADRRGLPARRVLQDDLRLLRESQVVAGQHESELQRRGAQPHSGRKERPERSQGDDGTVNGSEHLHQGQEHWWLRRHHVPPRPREAQAEARGSGNTVMTNAPKKKQCGFFRVRPTCEPATRQKKKGETVSMFSVNALRLASLVHNTTSSK